MALYQKEVEIGCKAVRLASRLCQTVQKRLLAEETTSKSDKSPVTVADYGSQALVSWALEASLPAGTFSLVAEEDADDLRKESGAIMLQRITQLVNETIAATEGGVKPAIYLTSDDVSRAIDKGSSNGGAVGRHWVLDPIDGTKGFMRGEQYAVALGLLDEGEVVLGILGCPNLPMESIAGPGGVAAAAASGKPVGCLFAASKGSGTTVQPMDLSLPPQKVTVSKVSDPAWASFCESFESAHSLQGLTSNIARVLGVANPAVRIDSQAKYGVMARGDAAIYMRFPHLGYREKIWDHCAGAMVIQEAGGVVVDAAGRPLDFSRGRFLDIERGILATNPQLLPIVLAAVQTVLRGEQPSQE